MRAIGYVMHLAITQLWRDKLDVIFPRSCVHCGGVVEGGRLRHLCPACERLLFVVAPPHCTTCGQVNALLGAHPAGFVETAAGLKVTQFQV